MFSRVLSKFKTLFWRSVSVQSHYFQVVQTVHVWSENAEDDNCCGRMAMTVAPEHVSRVQCLMTYAEIQDITKISSGSFTRILHDCLGVRKRCTRWVPHKLSEEQKRGRVDWCTHMQRKFDGGRSPRVWNIVTVDETWVCQ